MDPSERKKQTHLRCERQRREAINSGYNELKDLLPPSSSFAGCKTTNAAILFRASDYVKTLEASIDKNADELGKLQNQYSALEIIFQQYENLSIGVQQQQQLGIQLQMLQYFLDSCYESFEPTVEMGSYQKLTRTLLTWIEQLNFQRTAEGLLAPLINLTQEAAIKNNSFINHN